MKALITTLLLFFFNSVIFAQPAVYYVHTDGNDSSTGLSWDNAFATFQKAYEEAYSLDQVWIAARTYYPTSDHGVGDEIRLDNGLYPVHVTDLINTDDFISSAIENTRVRNPELYERALYKASIQETEISYEVGDEHDFYVLKFYNRTGSQYSAGWFDEVTARLMAVGDVSHVWVSVDELENEHITQTEIDAIMEALEERTPSASYNPGMGIFELVRNYFGFPPNIDQNGNRGAGNGKTDVLLTDIHDGWDPDEGGGFVAGFFFTLDQNTTQQFSNRRDIIYIDTYPGIYNPLQERRNPERPLNTLAHEFQHLVFHNYRGTTQGETWLNEGLSEFSEAFCGFGLRSPARYFSNTNRSMTRWAETTSEEVLGDRSRVALWTMYLWEQLGNDYIRNLVQLPATYGRGIQIVNRAAQEEGTERRFPDLFEHFNMANYVNDKSIDVRYGYDYPFDGRPSPRQYHNDPNVSRQGIWMPAYASYFIEYTLGDSLEIRFNSSSNITIKAIEIGSDIVNVVPVSVGETYIQNDYGDVYSTIMFAVINTGASSISFEYSSEGGFRYSPLAPELVSPEDGETDIELKTTLTWETSETAEHYNLQLATNNQFANIIDEVENIADTSYEISELSYSTTYYWRVNAENEVGVSDWSAIWSFTTIDDTYIDIISPNGGERWDMGSEQNIMWSSKNVIDVKIEYSINNGASWIVVVDSTVSTGIYIWNIPDTPTNQALIRITDFNNSNVYAISDSVFAIQTATSVSEYGIPAEFVLHQNYPNPFNPSTIIRYGIPERTFVQLSVYDALGKLITRLVNDEQDSGYYEITFDASHLPSGVYIYRMQAGEYVESRKMLYIK